MLAYVFWHWRRPEVPVAEYESRLRAFHAALATAPPDGFRYSWSAAVAGAPWAAGGEAAYEDWYLLRDSAALDPLNHAAVSAARQQPHDAAAAVADAGTAGLYRLRLGAPPAEPRIATWFAKPEGMPYAQLWAEMESVLRTTRGALWGRQMVLGPAPEFCLHTEEPVAVPPAYQGRTVALCSVWAPPVVARGPAALA